MKTFRKRFLIGLILLLGGAAGLFSLNLIKNTLQKPSEIALDPSEFQSKMIREAIQTYYREQQAGMPKIEQVLQELSETAPEAARRWRSVFDYWNYVNTEMPLNQGVLPDGLDSGDGLCIVILGYQLNPDGSMAQELIGRLQTGLLSAQKYPNAYLLCTGGGTASRAKNVTEAGAMAAWLQENGVSSQRILVENKSMTTTENAIFSCQILRNAYPEISQVAIVSSSYHIPWAAVLFQTQFLLGDHPISVVSNAAFPAANRFFNLLAYQANGILEIADAYR